MLNFTYIISKTDVSKCHSIPLVPMGAGTDKKRVYLKWKFSYDISHMLHISSL